MKRCPEIVAQQISGHLLSGRAWIALLLALVPLLWGFDPFRTSNTAVEEGNAKLGAGKYKQALDFYDKAARELPDSAGVQYNRGIALSRLSKLQEARTALLKGTTAADGDLKARSYYNLGNVQLKLKQYKEAIDSYRRSLRLDHDHLPSKWNLEIALRQLKEQQKKEKKQQQKDQQKKRDQPKDKQDKQQSGDKGQDKPEDKQQPRPKQQQKKKEDPQQQKDRGKQQQPQRSDRDKPRPTPSQQQMSSVLDALDRNDRKMQRRRAQMLGQGSGRPVKDW